MSAIFFVHDQESASENLLEQLKINEEKRKANIIKAQNKEFFAFVMKTWVAEMKTESQISFEFLS